MELKSFELHLFATFYLTMNKLLLASLSILFGSIYFSQNIGVNSTGATPDNSAMLDVVSTSKGILIPRMSTAQRVAISSPATGLEVYDLTTSTFWYYNGTVWVEEEIGDDDWTVSGVNMYSAVSGNVGVGTTTPNAKFEVMGTSGDENTNGMIKLTSNSGSAVNLRIGLVDGSRSWIQSHASLPLYINTLGNNTILNLNGSNVGIGISTPTQKLDVQNGNARINNAFIGDVGHGANWAGFAHQNQNTTTGYSFLASTDGHYTLINKLNTGAGYIGFRQSNVDMAVINYQGNMGIGTTAPAANARLQVVGGSIMPATGNTSSTGIYFPANPGGGGGDEAYVRHYVESGENTKLVIANGNDADDDIDLQTGGGLSRINIDGDGSVLISKGVLFDCNDCGSTTTIDGSSNWGDLVIQGRVLSTNNNLHLSPPGGSRVIIDGNYRAAGGTSGQVGLDVDGGIRMRKNYYYFQRYVYCNCYGAGSASYTIGDYDFCSVAHVGFKNNQSATDEDDDVQCAVYPSAHANYGETTNWSSVFTYQYNSRPTWAMYLEAFQDTNGATCAAICINFD